jgi:hypothetical protein
VTRNRLTHVVVITLMLLVGGRLEAQQGTPHSVEQLQIVVRAGDHISVASPAGETVSGRIVSLSATQLILATSTGRRVFHPDEPLRIRQRRGDSLSNGAWIGMGVGIGLVLTAVAADGTDSWSASWVVGGVVVYGAMGAGVGVGVDALIRRQHVVWDNTANGTRISLVPLLGPQRVGAVAAWTF